MRWIWLTLGSASCAMDLCSSTWVGEGSFRLTFEGAGDPEGETEGATVGALAALTAAGPFPDDIEAADLPQADAAWALDSFNLGVPEFEALSATVDLVDGCGEPVRVRVAQWKYRPMEIKIYREGNLVVAEGHSATSTIRDDRSEIRWEEISWGATACPVPIAVTLSWSDTQSVDGPDVCADP